MKTFNIVRFVLAVICMLLFASGLFLFFLEINEVTEDIGMALLYLGAIHILMLLAYTFGGWDVEDYYEEHLSNIEEGHVVLHNLDANKIAKQKEEIKKLKAQIKKMRTTRRL